jgi:hypothetical protein
MIELDHTALVGKVLELQNDVESYKKALTTAVQINNTLEGIAESDERRITDLRRLVKWLQKGE